MNEKKCLLFALLFFANLNCVGIYNEPQLITSQNLGIIPKNIRIEFTGFHFYNRELQLLKSELLTGGFTENADSPLLLEILLEEKEVSYKYRFLHGANFVASLFSAGIIPYYTITQHKITYRLSDSTKILANKTLILELDQLRGLSMLPFTPFFWPSTAFNKSILDSWKKSEELK